MPLLDGPSGLSIIQRCLQTASTSGCCRISSLFVDVDESTLNRTSNVDCVPFPMNLRKTMEDFSIKGISGQGKFGYGLVLRQRNAYWNLGMQFNLRVV